MTDLTKLLQSLSNAFGPPGFEDEVVEILQSRLTESGIETKKDRLKNLYAYLDHGDRPIIQLDAHTDEVAFMVQSIRSDGMLPFITLGGIRPENLGAQRVVIKNLRGELIKGVIASIPPHFLKGVEAKAPTIDQLFIDVGARSEQELREDYQIDIGCVGVYDISFEADEARGLYYGRAFDCRIGCAALTKTLEALKDEDLGVSVVGSYSVQEEVGLRGAIVTSRTIKPDIAIVFEGAPADDTVNQGHTQTAIGRGPMLRHYDQGMITHPGFQRLAMDIAQEEGIAFQHAVRTGGRNNGASIHLSGAGVPTIVISLPVRYIHTGNNFALATDLENAIRLAVAIVKRLDRATIEQL